MVDAEFHDEEDKAAENQEPGAAQQHRAADTVKEVAETQTSAQSPAERKTCRTVGSHEDVTCKE